MAGRGAEFSVKVNGVPAGTPPEVLRSVFEAAGFTTISDVYLPEKFARFEFGFVRFASEEEAAAATSAELALEDGSALHCELSNNAKRAAPGTAGELATAPAVPAAWAQGQRGGGTEYSVWVSGFSAGTTTDQLRQAFASRGVDNATDVYIPPGKDFGFLRFGTGPKAAEALGLCTGLEVSGAAVELKLSEGKRRRHAAPAAIGPVGAPLGADPWGSGAGAWGPARSHWPGGSGAGGGPYGCGKGRRAAPPADAGGNKPSSGEYSIWVGGLPRGASTEALGSVFVELGVEAMSDVYIPPGKDFGFVRFSSSEEAEKAMQLVKGGAGLSMGGQPLEVKLSSSQKRGTGFHGPPPAGKDAAGKGTKGAGWSGDGLWGHDPWGNGAPHLWGKGAPDPWGKGEYDYFGKGAWYDDWGQGFWPCAGPYGKSAPSGGPGKCGPSAHGGEISIKVGSLAPGTTPHDLRQAFADQGMGSLTDAYVPGGRSYGFVRFARMAEAQRSLALQGTIVVRGQTVSLEMAEGGKRSAGQYQPPQHAAVPSRDYHPAGKDGCKGSWHGGGCGEAAWGCDRQPWGGKGGCGSCSEDDRGQVSVKIGNLPDNTTSDEVREAFAAHGVDSMTDCYIPSGKKFGFLRFASLAEGEFAVTRVVYIRGSMLSLEPSMSAKKTAVEMASAEPAPWPRQTAAEPAEASGRSAPHDPHVSLDAPSVKVSGLPPGASSEELHQCLIDAGCTGNITDVYIPKGDRGFGFVRFERPGEAEGAVLLQGRVQCRGFAVELEVSNKERKASAGYSAAGPPAIGTADQYWA